MLWGYRSHADMIHLHSHRANFTPARAGDTALKGWLSAFEQTGLSVRPSIDVSLPAVVAPTELQQQQKQQRSFTVLYVRYRVGS